MPGGRPATGDVVCQDWAELGPALARWPEEGEEEYSTSLGTLAPMFHEAGLALPAKWLGRINRVVWGWQ